MTLLYHIAEFTFWISFGLVFICFFGLRWMLLAALPPDKEIQALDDKELPSVSVLIAAYNEEEYITTRLNNLLSSHYPADKIRVFVVSDKSTDNTLKVVQSLNDHRVTPIEAPKRMGKLGILDWYVPQLPDDFVLITDCKVKNEPDALRKLMSCFADPKVGIVGANSRGIISSNSKDDIGDSRVLKNDLPDADLQRYYLRGRNHVKTLFSRVGRSVALAGTFYAFRKEVFKPLKTPVHDDVVLAMETLATGWKSLLVPDAKVFYFFPSDNTQNFKRKTRLAVLNLTTLPRVLKLAFKTDFLTTIFTIFHLIVAWLSIYLILLALIAVFILHSYHPFYQILGWTAMSVILLGTVGLTIRNTNIKMGIISQVANFMFLASTRLLAVVYVIRGGVKEYWNPKSF